MTSKEITKAVLTIQHAPIGKAIAILHNVYAQGYAEGHAACCDELCIEDGDEVVTMNIEELSRRMSLSNTVDGQLEEILRGIKEVNR